MSLGNKVYRITTNIKPPFVMFDKKTKVWSGLIVDYMETIASHIGMKYKFHVAADEKYGYPDDYGNWDGMIGELLNKKADIAFGGLTQSAERTAVVDFTDTFYDSVGFSILMKRKEAKTKAWGWLTSLEYNVWICIVAAYLVSSILVWIFDTWSPFAFRNCQQRYKDIDASAKRFFTLKESLWYSFTALTPQGGGDAPKCLSARLTSATWWLFGFIIVASYTANMAAHLTLARLEFTIENYADLVRQLRVKFGPVEGSAAHHYYSRMKTTEEIFYDVWRNMTLNNSLSSWERAQLAVWEYPVGEKYSKMYRHMTDGNMPKNIGEAVKKIIHKKGVFEFALVAEYPDVLYNTMINCDLKMLPDVFAKRPYAIAVRKGSPLRNHLNKALYNLSNTDYLKKLKKKWWQDNPVKKPCVFIDDRTPGLIIQNIAGLFIFVASGMIAAYVTLIFEFLHHFYLGEKLDKIGHYFDKKFHILATLHDLGITKLKRPCKLAKPDIKSVDPIKESLEKQGLY